MPDPRAIASDEAAGTGGAHAATLALGTRALRAIGAPPGAATLLRMKSSTRLGAPLLLLSLCLLLGGCIMNIGATVSQRSPEELGPFPDDYREIVKRWIDDNVRGISGIETLSISKPRAGFADSVLTRRRFGWWTHASFRARDRIGMPTGRLAFSLLIRDGRVIARQKRLD
jgi:hypothetical protein